MKTRTAGSDQLANKTNHQTKEGKTVKKYILSTMLSLIFNFKSLKLDYDSFQFLL